MTKKRRGSASDRVSDDHLDLLSPEQLEALATARWRSAVAERRAHREGITAIWKDFKIEVEHRVALAEAINRAYVAYVKNLPHLAPPDPRPVWDALRAPLWETVGLLNDLIGHGMGIGDLVAEATTLAFGPGAQKPAEEAVIEDPIVQTWLDRQHEIDQALDEMVGRLVAVGRIADEIAAKPKQRPDTYHTYNAALRAAAEVLVTEFWRGVLKRPCTSNHPGWIQDKRAGPKTGKDATDRFFWDCMRATGVTAQHLAGWNLVSRTYADNKTGRSGRPPKLRD